MTKSKNKNNQNNEKFSFIQKHPFVFYFIVSWILINWKVVLFLLFDPVKAQVKINAITNLFIPKNFCISEAFSFICLLSSNWNPDNKFLTFVVGLPLLIAFLASYFINKKNNK